MTDQLTDDALYKRAESMYYTGSYTAIVYSFDALQVHWDGLRVLERCNHNLMCPALPLGKISSEEVGDCNCGLDQHIASLRELLGVSQ